MCLHAAGLSNHASLRVQCLQELSLGIHCTWWSGLRTSQRPVRAWQHSERIFSMHAPAALAILAAGSARIHAFLHAAAATMVVYSADPSAPRGMPSEAGVPVVGTAIDLSGVRRKQGARCSAPA